VTHPLWLPDPLIGRYLESEGLLEPASRLVSEAALYLDYCLKVELALLKVLARRGFLPDHLIPEAVEAAGRVRLDDFCQEESRVHHDLKALINVFTSQCPEAVRPFVHLGATSYDILSNAHLMRLRAGVEGLVLPALRRCCRELARLARREAGTLQIGRTHGQHAEPLTFGLVCAVHLDRLGGEILAIRRALAGLRGKFSGAVGAFVAQGLLFEDPEDFEREVLAEVGLEPARASTQIVPPEPALAVLHHLTAAFGVLANLADDMRHLQRTEIDEVAEFYDEEGQVGSSAMPHKRNPITWENVKSLWKTFAPQVMTWYLDQVSEHQRDLSNSASARFQPRLVLGLAVAGSRASRALRDLEVLRDTMEARVLQETGWLSGPLQVLLSAAGVPEAHEGVRRAAVQARRAGRDLLEVVAEDPRLGPVLAALPARHRAALKDPGSLTGPARRRALALADHWDGVLFGEARNIL
jgi:adenylosuccinate lyase